MKIKATAKIDKITIRREVDTCPDLSYLGTFSNNPGKFPIEHEPNNPRSYPYFNAENVDDLKQARQNYDRVMRYDSGDICDYGITARATVHITGPGIPAGNALLQEITSGGLWGLASDGTPADFAEVERGQLDQLITPLQALGFSTRAINTVIHNAVKAGE